MKQFHSPHGIRVIGLPQNAKSQFLARKLVLKDRSSIWTRIKNWWLK